MIVIQFKNEEFFNWIQCIQNLILLTVNAYVKKISHIQLFYQRNENSFVFFFFELDNNLKGTVELKLT